MWPPRGWAFAEQMLALTERKAAFAERILALMERKAVFAERILALMERKAAFAERILALRLHRWPPMGPHRGPRTRWVVRVVPCVTAVERRLCRKRAVRLTRAWRWADALLAGRWAARCRLCSALLCR